MEMEMKMAGHFRERPKHHWELEIKSAAFIMDIMLSCFYNGHHVIHLFSE